MQSRHSLRFVPMSQKRTKPPLLIFGEGQPSAHTCRSRHRPTPQYSFRIADIHELRSISTVAMSPGLARSGGRVVVLGVLPSGTQVPIEPFDLLFREIQLHFSFMNPFTHDRAAWMIADGVIEVSNLITRQISLFEAAEAIAAPAPDGEVRAIVVPGMSKSAAGST